MSTSRPPTEEELRRLARGARERARIAAAARRPGRQASAAACEVCGAAEACWAGLCSACRERLRHGMRGGDRAQG